MTPPIRFKRDIKRKQEKFIEKKRNLKIGIYGSFDPDCMSHITSLKEALISQGYEGTRISYDTRIDLGAAPADNIDAINGAHSHILLKESKLHIFIFCNEDQNHPNLMQSAIIELSRLDTRISEGVEKEEQYILILLECGYKDTCKTLFRDILTSERVKKEDYPFSNTEEIILIARNFCFNCILRESANE